MLKIKADSAPEPHARRVLNRAIRRPGDRRWILRHAVSLAEMPPGGVQEARGRRRQRAEPDQVLHRRRRRDELPHVVRTLPA